LFFPVKLRTVDQCPRQRISLGLQIFVNDILRRYAEAFSSSKSSNNVKLHNIIANVILLDSNCKEWDLVELILSTYCLELKVEYVFIMFSTLHSYQLFVYLSVAVQIFSTIGFDAMLGDMTRIRLAFHRRNKSKLLLFITLKLDY
jgi:hypothetical protein